MGDGGTEKKESDGQTEVGLGWGCELANVEGRVMWLGVGKGGRLAQGTESG